jgi:hypothetical protein
MKKLLSKGLGSIVMASTLMMPLDNSYVGAQRRDVSVNSRYHPKIEDYERKLEREISGLLPTYKETEEINKKGNLLGEYLNREINNSLRIEIRQLRNDPVLKKIIQIQKNPRVIQNNHWYAMFSREMNEAKKIPNKEGRLDFGTELLGSFYKDGAEDAVGNVKNYRQLVNLFKFELGLSIDLFNSGEKEKAWLFTTWINGIKDEELQRRNGEDYLFLETTPPDDSDGRKSLDLVLSKLGENNRFLCKNPNSKMHVYEYPRHSRLYMADYSSHVKIGDVVPILCGEIGDNSDIGSFENIYSPSFNLGDVINLGSYSLSRRKFVDKMEVKLFGSDGKLIVSGNKVSMTMDNDDLYSYSFLNRDRNKKDSIYHVRQFRVVGSSPVFEELFPFDSSNNSVEDNLAPMPKELDDLLAPDSDDINIAPVPPVEEK